MDLVGIKYALNAALGDSGFQALDKLINSKIADAISSINTNINNKTAAGAVKIVKSVQRGTYNEERSRSETATVTINPINTAKSILIINASANINSDAYSICGEITNSTTITLWHTHYDGSKYYEFYNMKWQVIEFY